MNIYYKGLDIDITIIPNGAADITSYTSLSDPRSFAELEINGIKIADEDELISCLPDHITSELMTKAIEEIKGRRRESNCENKRSFL